MLVQFGLKHHRTFVTLLVFVATCSYHERQPMDSRDQWRADQAKRSHEGCA